MEFESLSERDRVEVERSAAEARATVLTPVDVDRYLNPPADTPYGLEYSFYFLGDVQGKACSTWDAGQARVWCRWSNVAPSVIGIDISPDLVALARQRLDSYGLSAVLQEGSAYATGLPNESVDVVFSMALLHHLDLPQARQEIFRVLRPGGLFIFREPIRFSRTMNYLRQLFPAPKADISDYEHPMTRAELAVVMQGFTLVAERDFRLPSEPLLARVKLSGRWTMEDRSLAVKSLSGP